jgi:hypothetical protein
VLEPSETSYFSEPSATLDPRLFKGTKLNPTVRSAVLQLLFNYLDSEYTGANAWSQVWLAGSGVSHHWAAHRDPGDLDCLIGIDYRSFRASNNKFAGLSDQEIASTLNEGFREKLHPITDRFLGAFELTFYVNVRSNIVDIKPYAAYSLTNDDWTVEPEPLRIQVSNAWTNASESDRIQAIDILTKYQNAKTKYEQASNDAIKANARSEMRIAMSQGVALYESVHTARSYAFSPSGEGYSDFANYRWQAGKQSGVIQALRSLKDEMDAQDEALNRKTYGVDLPDADTLIRRAATRRFI